MSSKQYFKEVATEWDGMANSFFGENPRQTISAHTNWQSANTIADLGCGSGYLTELAINKGKKVIAVDQSQEMLDLVGKKYPSDQVTTRQGDGGKLPLDDNEVDVAMANMFLHHVDDPAATIKEAYRVVKPGGQWIFTDLDSHDHDFLVTEQHDKWMGFERSDIMKWMQEAGFKNVMIECVGADCCATAQGCDSTKAAVNIFIAKGEK